MYPHEEHIFLGGAVGGEATAVKYGGIGSLGFHNQLSILYHQKVSHTSSSSQSLSDFFAYSTFRTFAACFFFWSV
jgi:hypothetical protein